ncbi:MAG: CoA-binding protein [Candidatus Diapherotrites archaeon]
MPSNIQYAFSPKSVAIIGASRNPGKIGYVVLENFVKGVFRGKVFPVNPNAEKILNLKTYPSVSSIKEKIDLAIIAVPGAFVPNVIEECGKKKVKSAVIISAGFSEIGNKELTTKLEKALKKFPDMPCIGPNCLGILDTRSGVDTLFLPRYRLMRPQKGKISFISQSGALGSAVLDWAGSKEYGINKFISYGNAMSVNEADLLEYLANDNGTKVICVYLEGVRNGKQFFQTAKKYAKKKPIIIIKGGMSEAGGKATASHTGSLAGNTKVFEGVVRQTGLLYASSMREVFDYARVLETEPKPKGNKVQIITNGGGYGVLTADAISEAGMTLAKMQEQYKKNIEKASPSYAVIKNPMDLTGDADNARFLVAIENAMKDTQVDALIVILLFQVPTLDSDIIEELSEQLTKRKKPVLVVSAGGEFAKMHMRLLEKEGIHTFEEPIDATKALHALTQFHTKK